MLVTWVPCSVFSGSIGLEMGLRCVEDMVGSSQLKAVGVVLKSSVWNEKFRICAVEQEHPVMHRWTNVWYAFGAKS